MTGFDETVPTDRDPDHDATAADEVTENTTAPTTGATSWDGADDLGEPDGPGPAHDSTIPALEDDPDPDEPGGE